jgi:hypothetical protein
MSLFATIKTENYTSITHPLHRKKHKGKEYFSSTSMETITNPNNTLTIVSLPCRGIYTKDEEFPTLFRVNGFDVEPSGSIVYITYFKKERKTEIRRVDSTGEDVKLFEVNSFVADIKSAEQGSVIILERDSGLLRKFNPDQSIDIICDGLQLNRPHCFERVDKEFMKGYLIGDQDYLWLIQDNQTKQILLKVKQTEDEEDFGKGIERMEITRDIVRFTVEEDSMYSTYEICQYNLKTREYKTILSNARFDKENVGNGLEGFYTEGETIIFWTEYVFSTPLYV